LQNDSIGIHELKLIFDNITLLNSLTDNMNKMCVQLKCVSNENVCPMKMCVQ